MIIQTIFVLHALFGQQEIRSSIEIFERKSFGGLDLILQISKVDGGLI